MPLRRLISSFLLAALILISGNVACAQKLSKELKQLRENLSGRFRNDDQARFSDEVKSESLAFKQIWSERSEGLWLYGERSYVDSINKPYQKFVWLIRQTDENRFLFELFTLKNPSQVNFNWNSKEAVLSNVSDSDLVKENCVMYVVRKTYIEFTGGSKEKNCLLDSGQATYKTIELYTGPNMLMWWEKGFDKSDKQVYGSVKTGLIFRKTDQYKY